MFLFALRVICFSNGIGVFPFILGVFVLIIHVDFGPVFIASHYQPQA